MRLFGGQGFFYWQSSLLQSRSLWSLSEFTLEGHFLECWWACQGERRYTHAHSRMCVCTCTHTHVLIQSHAATHGELTRVSSCGEGAGRKRREAAWMGSGQNLAGSKVQRQCQAQIPTLLRNLWSAAPPGLSSHSWAPQPSRFFFFFCPPCPYLAKT